MDPAHLAFLHTLPGSTGFTVDLAALGEWDFMETPAGMVYIDTRRQGDRVWVRIADFIPPNIHQFPPNADPMRQRTSVNRPTATRWAVPIDDRHTMQIGFNRALEGREVRRGAGFGQDGSRPYEERQRVPGDYDAQVSIRGGIARHGLEHLASTDRGVTMFLKAWMAETRHSGIEALARFARGLQDDLAAVTAGLTLGWSNGVTEGQIHRLKLVKRQGYGRAGFALVRQRVRHAA
jgi:hypothetical protein